MKVNLYTKQHKNSIYELENKGRMTNKEIYVRLHMMDIADFFSEKYNKFVEMAEKIVPRPKGIEYPIWCSVSRDNCLRPDENSLVYCLEVPFEEVIYFSSIKWDYVLNNLYIGKDKKDEIAFNKNLEKLGIKSKFEMIDGKYKGMFPIEEKKIKDSWERIFELDEFDEFKVQANIWEIKDQWVKHIVKDGEDLFEITKDMGNDLESHLINLK